MIGFFRLLASRSPPVEPQRYPTDRMTTNPYAPTRTSCQDEEDSKPPGLSRCCPVCDSRQSVSLAWKNGKTCWCCRTPLDAKSPRWLQFLLNGLLIAYLTLCAALWHGVIPWSEPMFFVLASGGIITPVLRLVAWPFCFKLIPCVKIFPDTNAEHSLRREYAQRSDS